MTGRPKSTRELNALFAVPTGSGLAHRRPWPVAGIIATAIWVAYLLTAYAWFGPAQPVVIQRLLGAGCAILALAAFLLCTRRERPTEETLRRRWLAQRSDFGKELLAQQEKSARTIKLPWLGETRLRLLGGIAVFGMVAAWWMSPLAPVHVAESTVSGENFLNGEHPAIMRQYATFLASQGRQSEAARILERALNVQEERALPSDPELRRILTVYASVLRAQNPPDTERAEAAEARVKQLSEQYP
jgi:hypothetical protein